MEGGRSTAVRRVGSLAAGIVLALSGVLVAPATPLAAAPTSDGSTWQTATIPLASRGIAYDAVRDRLLVAVSPSVPTLGNRLVEIDPHTGALGRSVWVGSDPSVVAVADDGSRAYVGLLGAPLVAEVDLSSFTITRQFSLGSGHLGPHYAEDIEVQPGSAGVIAISRRNVGYIPRHTGVAIYADGVMRPTQTQTHTGPTRITWSDDPALIYGYNNESTQYGMYRLGVDVDGVAVVSQSLSVTGDNVDIEYTEGLLQATTGQVVDIDTMTLDVAYTTGGKLEADEAQGKTFFLKGPTLSRHDTATRLPDWSVAVPNVDPTELVDAGEVLAAQGPSQLLLMGPGVSSAGFVLPPAPPSLVRARRAFAAPVRVEELAAATDGDRVYGVRATGLAESGDLVEIDAETGVVTRRLTLGADPHQIAVSSDGSTLLVGHRSANRLSEVAVGTFTLLRTIDLPPNQWANDIAAPPGSSRTFAVALINYTVSPGIVGTVAVRDGVILPDRTPNRWGGTSITFGADPGLLYGYNGATTEYGFYTMAVTSTGITPISMVRQIMRGFRLEVGAADGLVYSSDGDVIDPTVPSRLGEVAASGHVVPVPDHDRLLIVDGGTIHEFDLDDYSAVGATSFAGAALADALLVGSTMAVATSTSVVFIPIGPDGPVPPTVTSIAPSTGVVGMLVAVRGTALRDATSVTVGGVPARFFVINDRFLVVRIPQGAGTAPVVVVTDDGTSETTSSSTFHYADSQRRTWGRR
jgi:hypothetical protein